MATIPSPDTIKQGMENIKSTYGTGSSDPDGSKNYQAYASKVGTVKANQVAANSGKQSRDIEAKEKADPASVRRAKGGPVKAGKSYIVGEKGPEKFIPTTDGKIISHGKLKKGLVGLSKPGPKAKK